MVVVVVGFGWRLAWFENPVDLYSSNGNGKSCEHGANEAWLCGRHLVEPNR